MIRPEHAATAADIAATEVLRARVEVPVIAYLWGKQHTVTPRLVDAVFGDGKALVSIVPLNTRPNYYVVRMDSDLAEDMDSDEFRDHVDDVVEAIAEQFGEHTDEPEHTCWGECCDWPVLNNDSGVAWEAYAVPAVEGAQL